ncbi:hypothetical protein JG688_00005700 [Phytophthora aleatoria]|uniref:Uncharacterized protein n=1 Tax=Phytophthora aleatoria TaxID=2496075 RepID=A0A8J5J0G4_9STRA|nr:hypothetical protein JG688_00005700 [Phytophthora aleatoria]
MVHYRCTSCCLRHLPHLCRSDVLVFFPAKLVVLHFYLVGKNEPELSSLWGHVRHRRGHARDSSAAVDHFLHPSKKIRIAIKLSDKQRFSVRSCVTHFKSSVFKCSGITATVFLHNCWATFIDFVDDQEDVESSFFTLWNSRHRE